MSALRHIMIVGSGMEAWLSAAYLCARLPHHDYKITVLETNDNAHIIHDLLARPQSKRIHHILQISEHDLGRYAKARPVLCAVINRANDDDILLPFGQYGMGREGTEFQQFWKRAGTANPLEDYNLAIAMHKAGIFAPTPPKGMPNYDYGYILDEKSYVGLLKKHAEKAQHLIADSCKVITSEEQIESIQIDTQNYQADFYIDASYNQIVHSKLNKDDTAWSKNCLSLLGGSSLLGDSCEHDHHSGMRFHRIQMAMERLIALWPNSDFSRNEISEYNRLTAAQCLHISDMNILLDAGKLDTEKLKGSECEKSETLNRKISVYQARGRIATEDYEIYSKAEWIAALTAAGITAQSHDRLADRMNDYALRQWMAQLKTAIDNLVTQGLQQRA